MKRLVFIVMLIVAGGCAQPDPWARRPTLAEDAAPTGQTLGSSSIDPRSISRKTRTQDDIPAPSEPEAPRR
jgi:hypothetical protein